MAVLDQLSPRERGTLILAMIVVGVFVLWLAIWRPMDTARLRLDQQIQSQSVDLEWMRAAAWEAQRLTAGTSPTSKSRGRLSLLALAEQSAREAGLTQAFRRGEPAGDGQVRIWLEGAAFDRLLTWLESLEQSYSISLESGSLDPTGVPGLVNARLLLAER